MGTTRFSGPIKAGTIPDTYQNTDGNTITANVGFVVMAQSAMIDIIGADNTTTVAQIPANSQIIDCVFDIITAANTTTNISVGFVGGAATALVNAYTIGTTAGRQYPTTKAGGALAWEDIGTSDQRLNFTNSAATNAGECRVTILYQQNINLS